MIENKIICQNIFRFKTCVDGIELKPSNMKKPM